VRACPSAHSVSARLWVKEFEGVVENDQVTQFQVVVKLSFWSVRAEAQAERLPLQSRAMRPAQPGLFLCALRRSAITERGRWGSNLHLPLGRVNR
jgi:hypothetical protein